MNFKLYSSLLQCSRCVQSQNGVDLVDVNMFYKSEKTCGQTIWPMKKNSSAFVSYHGRLVFRLFCYTLGISSSKMKLLHYMEVFQKLAKTEMSKNSADQHRTVTAFISYLSQASNLYHGFWNAFNSSLKNKDAK